jgi:hypothetical protein
VGNSSPETHLMREITVIFLSTWKFAATFPIAIYLMRMSFVETLLYTNIGGALGSVVFFYFSFYVIKMWKRYLPERFLYMRKKIFTKATRRFVRIKIKYGLSGIVILSPVILSIPLGSFLAAKFYGTKPKVIIWLIAGQVIWSLVFTFFYTQLKIILT